MTGPWSFSEAVKAYRDGEVEQRRVEGEVTTAYRNHARAVEAHKLALARRMWELKREGIPATVCKTLAAGDPHVAALERHANEVEGLKETALIATWRANSDRKDINGLLTWASRRDLAEFGGRGPREPEPSVPVVFGGRS